jgi:purine-binding chemotaxis protein CheW
VDFDALEERLAGAERALASGGDAASRRRVLEARAEAIAGSRVEAEVEAVPVLAFLVGGERYAVDVGAVFQVLEARGLSTLPAAPPWLLGAMVARTRVVPVLDLRQLLGLEGGGMSDLAKIVVLEDEGDLFGVAVEDLEGRIDLDREKLAATSEGPFAWIAPDRLAVLDLPRVGAPTRG